MPLSRLQHALVDMAMLMTSVIVLMDTVVRVGIRRTEIVTGTRGGGGDDGKMEVVEIEMDVRGSETEMNDLGPRGNHIDLIGIEANDIEAKETEIAAKEMEIKEIEA